LEYKQHIFNILRYCLWWE